MKKYFILFSMAFYINIAICQTFPKVQKLKAKNTVNNVSIPANPNLFAANKTMTSVITVNFKEGAISTNDFTPNYINSLGNPTNSHWTPEAKKAFNHAVTIWSNTLESDVPITINAYLPSFSSSGVLGASHGLSLHANFGSSNPSYQTNTLYIQSLANKLDGSDKSSSEDMAMWFNANYPFYFGTDAICPSNKRDFVTTVLHEIGHGLGFTSSAWQDNSNVLHINTGYPYIYDRYLVNGNGDLYIDLSGQAAINSFLTSPLFFNGPKARTANGNSNVKMFSPSSWDSGSSFSHFDEGYFTPCVNGGANNCNSLMTPGLSSGEAVHHPGEVGLALLEDLGWTGSTLVTGTGNTMDFDLIYSGGNTHILQENSYIDCQMNYGNAHFQLEAYNENGVQIISQQNSNNIGFAKLTIGSLDMSKDWLRRNDNSIHLVLRVTELYSGEKQNIPFQMFAKPNKPSFEFSETNQIFNAYSLLQLCESQTLEFYAKGATSYQISQRSSASNGTWITTILNNQSKYTYTNLDATIDYDFRVEAMNNYGIVSSEILSRNKCALDVLVYPNPTVDKIKVRGDLNDNVVIDRVEITKITNPNITISKENTQEEDEVEINMDALPNGVYNINVKDKDGVEENKTFIKF